MSINANNAALNEILEAINNLPSVDGLSGGTVYTNIVYNDDNTVTLTDKDGVDHTMVCEYTDEVLSSLTYDGKTVELTYEEDALVNIGAIEIDMANVPYESSGTEELEEIIDESGVLDSTDGTVEEKVEQLVDKAEDESKWYSYSELMTSMSKWTSIQVERLPRMSLKNVTSLSYSFSEMPNLKSVDFYLNTEKATTLSSAFQKCQSLKYIKGINTAKALTVHDIFANCTVLETIEEPLDFSSISSASIKPFGNCNALKNIRLVPETIKKSITIPSPVLSDESVQSTIDGLVDLTGGTAQTLTLNATVKAKLTEEQLATITSKNWNLA